MFPIHTERGEYITAKEQMVTKGEQRGVLPVVVTSEHATVLACVRVCSTVDVSALGVFGRGPEVIAGEVASFQLFLSLALRSFSRWDSRDCPRWISVSLCCMHVCTYCVHSRTRRW